MKRAAWSLLLVIAFAALAAPWLAPNPPNRRFDDLLYAPPTRARVAGWRERAVHLSVASRQPIGAPLRGRVVTPRDTAMVHGRHARHCRCGCGAPLLLLGADGYGRDVFSRLLHGARATLAVSLVSALLATMVGAVVGWPPATSADGSTAFCRAFRSSSSFCRRSTARSSFARCCRLCCHRRPCSCSSSRSSRCSVGRLLLAACARSCWSSESASMRWRPVPLAPASRVLLRHLLPASAWLHENPGITAHAGVHARGGDAVGRSRISEHVPTWGTMLQDASNVALLGDAPGLARPREFSQSFSASTCLRKAKGARQYRWSHEALHRYLHAHRHALPA